MECLVRPSRDLAWGSAAPAPAELAAEPAKPAAAASPGPLAAFARFVFCGGGIGLASSFAVFLLAALMPWAVANAVITVVSTVLASELHARFTFGKGGRCGLRGHLQSAGTAAGAYAVTTAAMIALHMVQSSPGAVYEQIVYLSASALAGVARFVVLRLFVFSGDKRKLALGTPAPRLGKAVHPGVTVEVTFDVTEQGVKWAYTWETGQGAERRSGAGSGRVKGRTYGWKPGKYAALAN
ncbi:GtrA family protein [Streptomyces aureocirculatus]|uniref:GtrA family protein n=1 Tax=Streptomyces aureocirculatus TaxID=67275 RepID=UPI0007C526CC